MTSAINPNNINGAYPVAGQDNDSQGFRDNFTNIKTNFEYAGSEISDIQAKAVLKAALSGTVLDNDMGGSGLSSAVISNFSATKYDHGTTSGTVTINYAVAHYQTMTSGGAISLAFTNFPIATAGFVRVQITIPGSYVPGTNTLTLPGAVSIGTNNVQGLNTATNTITFPTSGTFEFEFVSSNGGSAISIFDLNRNRDPIWLPSTEDVAASAPISLTTTTSRFNTVTSETATLADGDEGQIKILVMESYGGAMVVTVSSAGWKTSGSGTLALNGLGISCTLQYINGKWYCIGNNGASFG
jgi:hypothetical protein